MNVRQKLEKKLGKERILVQKSLLPLTTYKVGGPAEFFYEATSKKELGSCVKAAIEIGISYFVFGGGSNVLISDQGIAGLVIHNRARKISIKKIQGKITRGKKAVRAVLVEAESGALMNQLVRFAIEENLEGLEYHLGLPGTVGGALFMNSKWTNPVQYVGDMLYEAEIVRENGGIEMVPKSYFRFGYDQSVLQKTHEVVLSATFFLKRVDKKVVLWERANSVISYRRETQPIGKHSAGCAFRNIAKTEAIRIPTPSHTTSAGYLIDAVGLKGFKIGGAQFSQKHANFIINLGNATASDIKKLIDTAQEKVFSRFGVKIIPEIVLIGKF